MAERIYSLWLMPTGDVNAKFSVIINKLAHQYDSPVFPPHVTLVGAIPAEETDIVVTKTDQLASLVIPFVITLDKVDYLDHYFRALFVRAVLTPDVQTAYNKARQIFPASVPEEYMPHLSIIYSNIGEKFKKQIIEQIGSNFSDKFRADRVSLYLTDGDVSTWHMIDEYKFRGHD